MFFVAFMTNYDSVFFFFSSRRRHTRLTCDWSSDVCSSDLRLLVRAVPVGGVVDVLGRAVDRVVAAVVLERDDVLGVDVVRLAGGDPLGHRRFLLRLRSRRAAAAPGRRSGGWAR